MLRRLCILGILILYYSQWEPRVSYADDAAVLPEGVTNFTTKYAYWFPAGKRFSGDGGKKGDIEDIATNFNGVIDATVFTPDNVKRMFIT